MNENKPHLNKLLTHVETMEILRTSRYTLWKLNKNGELPRVKIAGRVLYDPSVIAEYIASCTISGSLSK